MSLKDKLSKSQRLDARLRFQISRLDDNTDPDKPLFSMLIGLDSNAPFSVAGADINQLSFAGDIATAHNVSLNGLKKGLV